MECCCYLRTFQDLSASVRKKIRHSTPWFKNSLWINDIVIGYALNVESGWTGVLLVADAETLRQKSTSKIRRIRSGTPKK